MVLQLVPSAFPENRYKTLKNTEIRLDIRFFPAEICSAHQNSLERNLNFSGSQEFSPKFALRDGESGPKQGGKLWKGSETYGRLA
jgi:hypothetical protein